MKNSKQELIEIIEIPGEYKRIVTKCPICRSIKYIRIYCVSRELSRFNVFLKCVTCRYKPHEQPVSISTCLRKKGKDQEIKIGLEAIYKWNKNNCSLLVF